MSTAFAPGQASVEHPVIHVLWMTSGLGCDGDTVSLTAATNPSLEDLLHGAVPGMPRISIYNPWLAFESGEEFVQHWHDAHKGKLDPFVLVIEGSIPDERLSGEGHWTGFGVDAATGQPIPTTTWIDRLAPSAAAVMAIGTCAAYGGIPAMRNNPTGAMGLGDYLGRGWTSRRGIQIINLPGCPVQPDSITETLLYLVLHLVGAAPEIDLDEQGRPAWLFERTVHENCDRAGLGGAWKVLGYLRWRWLPREAGLQGPRREVQCADPGLGQRHRRLPERRGHLQRMHQPRLPGQVHAVHGARPPRPVGRRFWSLPLWPRAEVPSRARDADQL